MILSEAAYPQLLNDSIKKSKDICEKFKQLALETAKVSLLKLLNYRQKSNLRSSCWPKIFPEHHTCYHISGVGLPRVTHWKQCRLNCKPGLEVSAIKSQFLSQSSEILRRKNNRITVYDFGSRNEFFQKKF